MRKPPSIPSDFVFQRGFYREKMRNILWHVWRKLPGYLLDEEFVILERTFEKGVESFVMPYHIFVQSVRSGRLKLLETQHVSAAVPLVLVEKPTPGSVECDE